MCWVCLIKGVNTVKYELLGKKISSPFTIPSGVITTEVQTIEMLANEIPELGIITTKSIGMRRNDGNKEPIIAQYGSASFINAVGLRNPGVAEFREKLSTIKIPRDRFLMISIYGANEYEFRNVAEKLYEFADGFELNLSCPHSKKYGKVVGQDANLVGRIVKSVSSLGKPVFIKVPPDVEDEVLETSIENGANGFVAINTLGPAVLYHNGYPVLSNKFGGISGKAILEIGIRTVRKIRKMTGLPIIAVGGISDINDVVMYKQAGASYFGIGSALAGMSTSQIKEYFHSLLKDLEGGSNSAIKILKDARLLAQKNTYRKYRINKKVSFSEDLYMVEFDASIDAQPGQFVFLWIPRVGEKPFSIFNDDPLSLLIKKRGRFTSYLAELGQGKQVYIRGPYGNSPSLNGRVLLVGGGTGIAALYLFAKRYRNCVALLGAKDKNHLPYAMFKDICELHLVTEEGEIGMKGLVTDVLESVLLRTKPTFVVNCGPEQMIRKAVKIEAKYVPQENIYSSIEKLTMCGIGLCGTCATPKGYRTCVDGNFLLPYQLF